MKTQIISIFSILFLLTGCNAMQPKQNDASLPKPPDGFSWHIAKNGVGTFLKPDGWYKKEETKGQTNALCWVLK